MVFGILIVGNITFAQTTPDGGNGGIKMDGGNGGQPAESTKLQNPLKADNVQQVILLAVNVAIYVGVSFAILAIIFVGFKFVFAQGNEAKLKEAKFWLLYIIIGLAILISAKVIVEIVANTLVKSGVVNEDVFKLPK